MQINRNRFLNLQGLWIIFIIIIIIFPMKIIKTLIKNYKKEVVVEIGVKKQMQRKLVRSLEVLIFLNYY